MDVEGYFPLYLLLYIPAIQQFGVDAECLATFLQDAPFAEVDMSRMTVRPKQNWEKVRLWTGFESSGLCPTRWAAMAFLVTP